MDYDAQIASIQKAAKLSKAEIGVLSEGGAFSGEELAQIRGENTLAYELAQEAQQRKLSKPQRSVVDRVNAEYSKIVTLENEKNAEALEYTISGRVGKFLEPMFRPIGFDWKLTTASIGALAAKEVFVSQLGILYAEGEADEESVPLREQLARNYTPLQGFCIMLFCLLTIPCFATLAVIKRELNSWGAAAFEAVGLFVLSYVAAFIVYQLGTALQIGTKLLG